MEIWVELRSFLNLKQLVFLIFQKVSNIQALISITHDFFSPQISSKKNFNNLKWWHPYFNNIQQTSQDRPMNGLIWGLSHPKSRQKTQSTMKNYTQKLVQTISRWFTEKFFQPIMMTYLLVFPFHFHKRNQK